MYLIAFVIAGQRVHHEIDPEPVRQGALSIATRDYGVWIAAGGGLLKCDRDHPVRDFGLYQAVSHAAPTASTTCDLL